MTQQSILHLVVNWEVFTINLDKTEQNLTQLNNMHAT